MCAIFLRFGLPSARAEPSRPSDSSVNVELVPFVGVAIVVIVSPGVDMALVARNSLLHGRNAGLATALGVNVGVAVWVIAAAAASRRPRSASPGSRTSTTQIGRASGRERG